MTRSDSPPNTPDPLDVAIGKRLFRLRKAAGLSRKALAEAASRQGQVDGTDGHRTRVTAERIRKTEAAESPAGPGQIYRMAAALGMPVSALLTDGEIPADAVDGPDPLRTPEGRALFRAFVAIEDEQVQREVAAVVRAIADDRDKGGETG